MSATAATGVTVPVTCREDLVKYHRRLACAPGKPLKIAANCHGDAPMWPDYYPEENVMVLFCAECGSIGMIVPICSYPDAVHAA